MQPLTKKQIFDLEFKYDNFSNIDKSRFRKKFYEDPSFWSHISKTYSLSSDVFSDFSNFIDWDIVSRERLILSDINFIRKYKDNLKWMLVWKYRPMYETYIEEFKDKIIWVKVSEFQPISEDFIRRHIKNIYYEGLVRNKYVELSPELIKKLKEAKKVISK